MEGRQVLFLIVAAMFVFVDCSRNTCADITKFKNVNENSAITGTTFVTLKDQTLVGCAKQCLLRSDCQSYNFELATGDCQLNEKNSTTLVPPEEKLDTKPGVVTSDRTSITPGIAGVCSSGCPGKSVCRTVAPGDTATCQVECHDPVFTNGEMTSEIAHDVGSVLTIECDPGFLFFGEAECQLDGTWKTFGCEQGCVNPPTVDDGNLVSTGTVWSVGTVLDYKCAGKTVQLGKVECKSDFTWTELKCITPVRTCSDLKTCGSNHDGEYWLVPGSSTPPVKIFCQGMTSTSPKEFLTLPEENYVDYSDISCDPRDARPTFVGCESTRFYKLRISDVMDLKTTIVGLRDYTFTNTTSHCYYMQYGNVHDCHADSSCNSPKTRDFVINTRGTGLKVNPNQQWNANEVIKDDSGRHITVKCNMACKWCYPIDDTYTFVIDGDLPADMDSATVPVC